MCDPGDIIDDAMDFVGDAVDFVVDLVVDVISWLNPIPEIPDFGGNQPDLNARGALVNKVSANAHIPIVYGTRQVGGNVVFVESSGDSNEFLYMCIIVSEGEIDDITKIFVNDSEVTFSGDLADNTQRTVASSDANYFKADPTVDGSSAESLITVEPHYGTDSQSASSLLSELSSWTSTHRLRGLAYLAFKFKWNSDAFGSLPQVTAIVKGRKVYNPNLDGTKTGGSGSHRQNDSTTWEYSDNGIYQMLDYLRNERFGMGIADSYFDSNFADWQTAGDVVDADITPFSGASTIDLLDSHPVVDTSRKAIDLVAEFVKGTRSYLNFTAGKYKVLVETSGSASVTLTEDNIIGGINVASKNKNSRYNRVIVNFTNENKNYQSDTAQFPPVDETGLASADTHSVMKTADGGILLESKFDFPMIVNQHQAQELAEIILRRSRSSLDVSLKCDGTALDLAIGDIVNITHATPSFSAKPFRIQGMTINTDHTVTLQLSEDQDSYYVFGTQVAPATIPDTTLPNPFSVQPPASLTLDDEMIEYSDGTVLTRLLITVGVSPDKFVENYEVQIKQTLDANGNAVTDSFREIATGKILTYQHLNVIDAATYEVRVRAVNTINAKSTFVSATRKIIGATDTPQSVSDFNISMTGSNQMSLNWTPVTDLDIEFYEIRYSMGSGTTAWFNTSPLVQVPRRKSNSVVVNAIKPPFNLYIKAVDKLGNESSEPAIITSSVIALQSFEDISSIQEETAFSGTFSNTFRGSDSVGNPAVTLDTITLFDSRSGLFDAADSSGFFFDTGGIASNITGTGNYIFSNSFSLDAIYDSTFQVELTMESDDPYDLFDSGRGASLFDNAKAPFDGNAPTNNNAIIQIGADNTALSNITSFTTVAQQGTFKGRFFKFRCVLSSANNNARPFVTGLKATLVLEKRSETGDDISSGTSTKSVTFTNGFFQVPNITVTGQDLSTGDFFVITNKSKTGFDIVFKNSSNSIINKTFDFNAQGVGLKT